MSTAMVLEGTRDYLQTQLTWTSKDIDVFPEPIPPPKVKQWYVTISDGGVVPGPDNSDYLQEKFSIIVGVWRRIRERPLDYLRNMLFLNDKYQPGIKTITDLERLMLQQLHHSHGLRNAINTQFALPNDTLGDIFVGPLMYQGRPPVTKEATPEAPNTPFIGHLLRFTGLLRTQRLSNMG